MAIERARPTGRELVKSQRAFGEALRRHRERSGVTLQEIARKTKISAGLLQALERGDCSRWPTGIYSRSYVRDYAVAVGLDPDDLASQFSACFAQTAFPDRPVPPAKNPEDVRRPEPLRLTFASEPATRWRIARRRAMLVSLDCLLIVVISLAMWITVIPNLWMALALVAVGCHSLVLATGGKGAAGLFAEAPPEPQPEEQSQESAVVEPI